MMPEPPKKFYTPREANQQLPALRAELDLILAKKRELDALRKQLDVLLRSNQLERYDQLRKQGEAVLDALETQVEQLQSRGVILRDAEKGLLDFPAIRFGEQVYLCWKRDEPHIGFCMT